MSTLLSYLSPSNLSCANRYIHEAAHADKDCKKQLQARMKVVGALILNILNVPRSLIQAIAKPVVALTSLKLKKAIQEFLEGIFNGVKSLIMTAVLVVFLSFSLLPIQVFSPLKTVEIKRKLTADEKLEEANKRIKELKQKNEKLETDANELFELIERGAKAFTDQQTCDKTRTLLIKSGENHSPGSPLRRAFERTYPSPPARTQLNSSLTPKDQLSPIPEE